MFWQNALDQTACCLNRFSIGCHQLGHPRRQRSFRILLSQRSETDAEFIQNVLDFIVVVSLVAGQLCLFRQVQQICFERWRIAETGRGQEEFNRLTTFGDQQMNFEAIVIPSFAGLIASKSFVAIDVAAANAVVVAYGHRKAVHHVDRMFIQGFPEGA